MSTAIAAKTPVIALLGQPNSGKSTLFNALTGARQHVGNWPGKTVEKKEGYFQREGRRFVVTDLPGTYSLSANSDEEIITRDYISGGKADVVCILADASQLERSLFMLADYAGIGIPAVLLLNLMDIAEGRGKKIDAAALEARLGIPVVPFVAADRDHYGPFYAAIDQALAEPRAVRADVLTEYYHAIEGGQYSDIFALVPPEGMDGYGPSWLAAKILEGDTVVADKVKARLPSEDSARLDALTGGNSQGALLTGGCKFQWIDGLLQGAVAGAKVSEGLAKFDRRATSRRWGKVIAILILLGGLIASFGPAAPIMAIGMGITSAGAALGGWLTGLGVSPIIVGLVCQVGINTLGFAVSMVGFVFSVNLVFGIIEEVGYMARVSYVFDSTMAKLGLQGKAVMPFLVSFGCTIGGAAGARVIDSWGQKVLTIALAWVVPCAATWSIVPLLSGLFFGAWAPVVVVAIFAVALGHMLITAKIFGPALVKPGERTGLIMELPPYHKPKWKALLRSIFVRTRDILVRALRVIFVVSLVFWLLTFNAGGAQDQTLLYRFGRLIEPVTAAFGFTWQTFLAFISSAISKEAALGVLSTLYGGAGTIFGSTLEGGAVAANLGELLTAAITRPQALAFIFAVTFNAPCLMAMSSTYQETRSLKWTLRILGYYMAMSLVLAFLAFHIGTLLL